MQKTYTWDTDAEYRPRGDFFVCVPHRRVMPPKVAMRHIKNNRDCKVDVFLLSAWKYEIDAAVLE